MSFARILNNARYGQRPAEVRSDAQWRAMVKQAQAEHQWKMRNEEAYGHNYQP